ncbi:MAG: 16S rRNA (cytosine(1402)-N(4))-methyltransferase RsmH [Candidatus Latescibacterota bacterium]
MRCIAKLDRKTVLVHGGQMIHTPVMVAEVLHYLLHDESNLILDATVGCGGHTEAILAARENLSVVCIDRDAQALALAKKRLWTYGERAIFYHGLFTDLEEALLSRGNVDGVLVDHGLSSLQLEDPHRGFSYQIDSPLDMKMGGGGLTATELIMTTSETELAGILGQYGELRMPRKMARSIKAAADKGGLKTTRDLAGTIETVFGGRVQPGVLSRIFQALRIAVNDELDVLAEFLGKILRFVNTNGRLVFISYHSLEDRKIKEFFKKLSAVCTCPPETPLCVCGRKPALEILTRKVVKTSAQEIASNSRSRSARLRAARVLA